MGTPLKGLSAAVGNGVERMAHLAGLSIDEARNRLTVTGSVEVGRLSGVAKVSVVVLVDRLEALGLDKPVLSHQGAPAGE